MAYQTSIDHVDLLDLHAMHAPLRKEIDAAIAEVLDSERYILGPAVEQCEGAIAGYSQCPYAVGVSSGTDALLAALMAEGIGPGDEVVTTPFSFFATAGCIARVGATPVFVDIKPQTFNIDAEEAADAVTDKTKAIIPVHLFGQLADMEPLDDPIREHQLTLIEDGAQAIGAERDGRRAGSWGDYGCFSFFPAKNLGAFGDGGIVTLREKEKATTLQRLRVHGSHPKYHHAMIGGNFRLDAIQAAIINVKIRYLDQWTHARQLNAQRYRQRFKEGTLLDSEYVTLPLELPGRHVYNQFVIRAERRDALREHLQANGVSTAVYYPIPLHLQECFSYLGYHKGDFPEAEDAAEQVLALPIHPTLTEASIDYVVEQIEAFYGK